MKKVHQLMSHSPRSIPSDASLVDAAEEMARFNIGSLIVVKPGTAAVRREDLVGIVTDRDIVVRAIARRRDPGITSVSEAMTTPVYHCAESDRIEDALEIMRDRQVRRLAVFSNDTGQLSGVLSLDDIAARMPVELAGDLLHQVATRKAA